MQQLRKVNVPLGSTIADKTLREKCPNTEVYLVRIFLYLDTLHTVKLMKQYSEINFTKITKILFQS